MSYDIIIPVKVDRDSTATLLKYCTECDEVYSANDEIPVEEIVEIQEERGGDFRFEDGDIYLDLTEGLCDNCKK